MKDKALNKVLALMERLREVHPELGAQTIGVFCVVAMQPGITVTALQEHLKLTLAAASRNWSILSNQKQRVRVTENGKTRVELRPGLGLIAVQPNLFDKRRRELHLTQAGLRLANHIVNIMGV